VILRGNCDFPRKLKADKHGACWRAGARNRACYACLGARSGVLRVLARARVRATLATHSPDFARKLKADK